MGKRNRKKAQKENKGFFDRLYELAALGVLDDTRYEALLDDKYGLSPLSDSDRSRLAELIEAVQSVEQSSVLRAAKEADLNAEVSRIKGIGAVELAQAYWYANILSGAGTQAINAFASAWNMMIKGMVISLTSNPRHTAAFWKGMLAGMEKGFTEARGGIHGQSLARRNTKFNTSNTLENLHRQIRDGTEKNPGKKILASGRFVGRLLSATDAFFYRTAAEGKAYMEAARLFDDRNKGDTRSLAEFMSDELFNSTEVAREAFQQAEADVREHFVGLDARQEQLLIDRRAFEIMETQRLPTMQEDADRFGALATYTQTPEGTAGTIANVLQQAVSGIAIPVGKKGEKIELLRPIVPFVNILANVLDRNLDFTPIGIARAVKGEHLTGSVAFTQQERRERMATGIMGSLVTATLIGLAEQFAGEDEDPFFAIYGAGPRDSGKRSQLLSQGWKPFSVKVGDTYVQFNELPFGSVLAAVGGYYDLERFSPAFDRKSAMEKLGATLQAIMAGMSKTGVLSGVSALGDVISGDARFDALVTRPGSGFIPYNALLRDISIAVDPGIRDQKTMGIFGRIVKDIPFVFSPGKPLLNALGEEVEREGPGRVPGLRRVFSQRADDPVWDFLARRGVFIPVPRDQVSAVVPRLRRDEKFRQRSILEERLRRLGRYAYGVLDEDELFEYAKMRGPIIREAIERGMERGLFEEMDRPTLQAWINQVSKDASNKALREVVGLGQRFDFSNPFTNPFERRFDPVRDLQQQVEAGTFSP